MNRAFEEKLRGDLDALKTAGTYKHLRHLTTPMAPEVHMEEAGDVIVLSSNNISGLADNPEVVEAGKRGSTSTARERPRFASSAERSTSIASEERIANLGTEASLSYVSCWNANTGLFPTICDDRLGDRLRRAQPRIDHRRRAPRVEGAARAVQAQRHDAAGRETARPSPAAFRLPS